MTHIPTIFDTCTPRAEVLAGELQDAIFAADLWDVVCRKPGTHPDYLDPVRFFAGTHPTALCAISLAAESLIFRRFRGS